MVKPHDARRTKHGESSCYDVYLLNQGLNPGGRTITYTLVNETRFYEELSAMKGIKKEWIMWKEMDAILDPCTCPDIHGCLEYHRQVSHSHC